MTKSKLSVFFDSFLISTILCVVIYIWINKYIKNAILSFFICNLIYILLFFVIFKKLNNGYNLNKIKISDQKTANKYLLFLTYSSDNSNAKYFQTLLSSEKIDNQIFKNKSAYFYINIKSKLTEFDFHKANNFYQNSDKTIPLVFIYNSADDSFSNLINNSPIKYTVIYYHELYNLMKAKNIYPTEISSIKTKYWPLKNFKQKISNSLTKKHFFKFLLSGLSLVLISIFIPYSFYYLIFGSILLLFSIMCLFSKNKSNTPQCNIDLLSLTKKD